MVWGFAAANTRVFFELAYPDRWKSSFARKPYDVLVTGGFRQQMKPLVVGHSSLHVMRFEFPGSSSTMWVNPSFHCRLLARKIGQDSLPRRLLCRRSQDPFPHCAVFSLYWMPTFSSLMLHISCSLPFSDNHLDNALCWCCNTETIFEICLPSHNSVQAYDRIRCSLIYTFTSHSTWNHSEGNVTNCPDKQLICVEKHTVQNFVFTDKLLHYL
jgi:hypothetical protein